MLSEMKAVILAGGEGSRLRPLTLGKPKPMTPLLGKPVLGHILDLLRRHGVTDIAVTLRYLPAAVTDFFGDGTEYGVSLRYFIEDVPLGTAGGVKKCMDFLGGEDFLVISGDAVCDLDLTRLMSLHKAAGSAASLALSRRAEPLEYGLVRTDGEGKVLGFVEKPGWGQVDTELVNTGIYLLSKQAMDLVPADTSYDFGKELFPALLAQGVPLYGWEIPGYWQDMGDCEAYLDSVCDALQGKVSLDLAGGRETTPAPAGVEVVEPCWIGKRVLLAPGCRVGPCAVIGEGSTVETGAVVERSVLLGAGVSEGAEVTGAILCKGAVVHRRAMVGSGAVLGEGVSVGTEAIVAPGVKLWPGRTVPEGGKVTASQVTAGHSAPLKFSSGGALRGTIGEELSPETMVALGSLLGEKGQVALGWAGGEGAGMLARSIGCGVAAAGGAVMVSDAPCASAIAWLGRHYGLPLSLFVQQDGDAAEVRLFGPRGIPLHRAEQRKLEGALLRGEGARVPAVRVGAFETVAGVRPGYTGEAARLTRFRDFHTLTVQVERGEPANDLLAAALTVLGCTVQRGSRKGLPTFSADWGGFRLTAWDEEGSLISSDRILTLLTRIEMEQGDGHAALPSWAPAMAERVADGFGRTLLRLGRDGEEAQRLWEDKPWFWDGVIAACRICARLGLTGEKLSDLDRLVPKFVTARGDVPLRSGRGRVMGAALSQYSTARKEGEGARIWTGSGWVYLVPLSRRSALRIIAEASDMETAQELCDLYREKLREMDEEE